MCKMSQCINFLFFSFFIKYSFSRCYFIIGNIGCNIHSFFKKFNYLSVNLIYLFS